MSHASSDPTGGPVQWFQQPSADSVSVGGELEVRDQFGAGAEVQDSFVSSELPRPEVRQGVQPTVLSYYSDPSGQPLTAVLATAAVVLVGLATAGIISPGWMWPIIIAAVVAGVVLRDTEEVVFADSGIHQRGVTNRQLAWDDLAHLVIVRGAVSHRIGGRPNRNAAALHLIMKPNSLGDQETHVMRIEDAKANRFAQWAQAKQVPTTWLDATADLDWRARLAEIGEG